MTTTQSRIGTCRYGHTTRTETAARIVECATCWADATITAERDAFLTAHPQGFFPMAVKLTGIRARVSDSECNGECTHAKGDKCICSCGGQNHGIGWAA